jgi:hypothetical protein
MTNYKWECGYCKQEGMTRPNYLLMRWPWCLFCTRPACLVGLHSWGPLKQQFKDRHCLSMWYPDWTMSLHVDILSWLNHVSPRGHIILTEPCLSTWTYYPDWTMSLHVDISWLNHVSPCGHILTEPCLSTWTYPDWTNQSLFLFLYAECLEEKPFKVLHFTKTELEPMRWAC